LRYTNDTYRIGCKVIRLSHRQAKADGSKATWTIKTAKTEKSVLTGHFRHLSNAGRYFDQARGDSGIDSYDRPGRSLGKGRCSFLSFPSYVYPRSGLLLGAPLFAGIRSRPDSDRRGWQTLGGKARKRRS
jgi:hypothetical protein